jgi:hypothetical protein
MGTGSLLVVAVCLALPAAARGTASKPKPEATPARPSGGEESERAIETAPYPKTDTVHAVQSASGETVYSIAASHFDVSLPLRDLARTARSNEFEEEEEKAPENPQLPSYLRRLRADVPDPVVQAVPQTSLLAAPVTGFNFLGVGTTASPTTTATVRWGTTSSSRP